MKAICYVRVSTEEQVRGGVSLEAQEEKLRSYCSLQGLEMVELVREEGVSASKPWPPGREGPGWWMPWLVEGPLMLWL